MPRADVHSPREGGLVALTREPSAALGACELTHLPRRPIDVELARAQHLQYTAALRSAGCEVITLAEAPELPDSVFVEDPAIVLDELAILTRPGAPSRRAEVPELAKALAPYRRLQGIEAPATLDGGDVLRIGRRIYVGRSTRTDEAALVQLRGLVAPLGYEVIAVPVLGCLHLKSAITSIADGVLLANRAWVDVSPFGDLRIVDVDPSEPAGANALRVGERLIYPNDYPKTAARLAGFGLLLVDASEVIKAEGAVTCCSLIFAA